MRRSISRAKSELSQQGATESEVLERVQEARFRNPIYTLPLGWRLSKLSRDIINILSGRFLDCDPDLTYKQTGDEFSGADCIQLLIYHQLNGSLGDDLRLLERGAKIRADQEGSTSRSEGGHLSDEQLATCYQQQLKEAERSSLQRRQKQVIAELVRRWNARPQGLDERWLAFILTAAYHR